MAVYIATNQGGPACRDAGWPWSDKYPSFEKTAERLIDLSFKINQLANCNYIGFITCWVYQTKSGQVHIPKHLGNIVVGKLDSFDINNRKPNPGMLLTIMKETGCTPQQTLYVGDADGTGKRDEDLLAAKNAGVDFMSASKFFAESI